MTARLELRSISKRWPSVVANDDISLEVSPGEIHALLGENGAGKSTLMKILYGVVQADSGTVVWEGAPVAIRSPAQARALGIGMVFQHFSLFETLTVVENIALGLASRESLAALAERIAEVSMRYGLAVAPNRLVHSLSVGERQRVEIVRCLLQSPRLLIMDEPTSVLAPQAIEQLFATLRTISAEGCSILYISHKLEEIRSLCHRATVLRAGRVSARCIPAEQTSAALAQMMIGTAPAAVTHQPPASGQAVRLEINGLDMPANDPFATTLADLRLALRSGEIVGIAGISGNGQSELVELLSGERRAARADMLKLDGEPIGHLGVDRRRLRGMGCVVEERMGRGAVPAMTLAENALLTARRGLLRGAFVDRRATARFARHCIETFSVKCRNESATARSLSGGNLQRFIVGREILQQPRVLVIAQPTWGVDVGAALFIRQALVDLRDAGCAILLISEDLDEIFEVADRIAVLSGGRLSPAQPAADVSVASLGALMGGEYAETRTDGAVIQGAAHASAA
jgi:simple sugar transport system ATP-binding protein